MALAAEDWSIVCVGRWNMGLFTPAQIAKRVFELSEGTPVEVYLAIDELQPPRVKHEGLIVTATSGRVSIELTSATREQLAKAQELMTRIVRKAGDTPLAAVGFNLRFKGDTLPPALVGRFAHDIDRSLSDLELPVVGREFARHVKDGEGRLMIRAQALEDEKAEVVLNFERKSTKAEDLVEWLAYPVSALCDRAATVMSDVLGIQGEEYVEEQLAI